MVEKKTNPGLPAWGTPDAKVAAAKPAATAKPAPAAKPAATTKPVPTGKPAAATKPADAAPAATGANPYTQWYEVQKGDTLWKIAKERYGDGSLYPEIFKANQDVLSDPDKIHVGQKLRIP